MKRPIDITTWQRRENYLFFRDFPNPFYAVTVRMDVTQARERARTAGVRFSQYLSYAALAAANSVEAMRYRQIEGRVWLFDAIRLNTPVPLPDHSFRSVIVPYAPTLAAFAEEAERIRAAALRGEGDAYGADAEKDTFCVSINPWYDFTGLSFQTGPRPGEEIPIAVIGRMSDRDGRLSVPLATRFHHGFVDGYHVGQYLERFQRNLDTL